MNIHTVLYIVSHLGSKLQNPNERNSARCFWGSDGKFDSICPSFLEKSWILFCYWSTWELKYYSCCHLLFTTI